MTPPSRSWSVRLRTVLRPPQPVEQVIGYRFRDLTLLQQALTHRSFRAEHRDAGADNQRLEFLGDAVLGLLTAKALYDRFPDRDEGVLTALRAQIASGETLAQIGREMGLGAYLFLGKGEEKSHGRDRPSNLRDAVEALLGAVYLDGGLKAAQRVFLRMFGPSLKDLPHDVWAGNPKGKLQDVAQRLWKVAPTYRLLSHTGPSHHATFTVEVRVGEHLSAQASGPSKRIAECRAAALALAQIRRDSKP